MNCPGCGLKGYEAYKGTGYTPDQKFDYTNVCRIAQLEKSLGRAPTFDEVREALGLDPNQFSMINDIPQDCRNGYRGFKQLPTADRK